MKGGRDSALSGYATANATISRYSATICRTKALFLQSVSVVLGVKSLKLRKVQSRNEAGLVKSNW